jgi:hypothetical protein
MLMLGAIVFCCEEDDEARTIRDSVHSITVMYYLGKSARRLNVLAAGPGRLRDPHSPEVKVNLVTNGEIVIAIFSFAFNDCMI